MKGQQSVLEKRSMTFSGRRTSVGLEPEFWVRVEKLAKRRGLSLPKFISQIDEARRHPDSTTRGRSLASCLRCEALEA